MNILVNIGAEWDLTGYIFKCTIENIERVKVIFNDNEYEMQMCYLEPILQKFSLRINNEMNPGFDYLTRLEELEQAMKNDCRSTLEQKLKAENESLKARAELLEQGIEIMRKALNDAQIKREPIIFDGV